MSFVGLLKMMVGITITNPYGKPYRPNTVTCPTGKESFMNEWLTVDIIKQEADVQRCAYESETSYIQSFRFIAAVAMGGITYLSSFQHFALPVFLGMCAWTFIIRPLQIEEPHDQAYHLRSRASRLYKAYHRAYNELIETNADDEAYKKFALDKTAEVTDLQIFQAINKIYPVNFNRLTAEDTFHRFHPNPW